MLVATLATGCAPETPDARWKGLVAGRSAPWNVILITIDTLRADRLSSYGGAVPTPHIDRLAAEGTRFDQASTSVPFTLPAHSTILTGTYPPHHGVRENVGYYLDDRVPTLAELLGESGYQTAGFVSAFVLDRRWGIARGFDHYFDQFDIRSERQVNLGSVQRPGTETLDETLRWVDARDASRPFFLWVHLFEPHDPYEPPEPFATQYRESPYDGEVAYVDSLIGELRDDLSDRGLLDDSLLVLTADHGEGLGDHGESFHGFFIYDSTVRVPLIVRFPLAETAGRELADPVSHVDIVPTVLEAIDVDVPEGLHGTSLLPLVMDFELQTEREVYSESYYPLLHYGWSPLRSLRQGSRKLIDAPSAELYDLAADPGEETNIFRRERGESSELAERLRDYASRIARDPADEGTRPDIDEAALAQLEALGYVAGRGAVSDDDPDVERADPKEKIGAHQSIMRAQSALSRELFAEAERRLQEALEIDDGMIDAWQMLGHIASRTDDPQTAIAHYQRALALEPQHKGSLFGLANAYRATGRREEALAGFRRLIDLAPHDSKAVLAATRIEVELGNRVEAIALLEAAVEREHVPPVLFNQLGELLVLDGRPREAIPHFEAALAANDLLAQPRFNLGVLAEESGDLDRAVELYQGALVRAPRHYQAHFNLARLWGRKGDHARELASHEAAIQANPEFVLGHYFLAKLLMDRGADLARAERVVREGLRLDPEGTSGPLGHFVLADVLNRQGRRIEARQAYRAGRALEDGGAESG